MVSFQKIVCPIPQCTRVTWWLEVASTLTPHSDIYEETASNPFNLVNLMRGTSQYICVMDSEVVCTESGEGHRFESNRPGNHVPRSLVRPPCLTVKNMWFPVDAIEPPALELNDDGPVPYQNHAQVEETQATDSPQTSTSG